MAPCLGSMRLLSLAAVVLTASASKTEAELQKDAQMSAMKAAIESQGFRTKTDGMQDDKNHKEVPADMLDALKRVKEEAATHGKQAQLGGTAPENPKFKALFDTVLHDMLGQMAQTKLNKAKYAQVLEEAMAKVNKKQLAPEDPAVREMFKQALGDIVKRGGLVGTMPTDPRIAALFQQAAREAAQKSNEMFPDHSMNFGAGRYIFVGFIIASIGFSVALLGWVIRRNKVVTTAREITSSSPPAATPTGTIELNGQAISQDAAVACEA